MVLLALSRAHNDQGNCWVSACWSLISVLTHYCIPCHKPQATPKGVKKKRQCPHCSPLLLRNPAVMILCRCKATAITPLEQLPESKAGEAVPGQLETAPAEKGHSYHGRAGAALQWPSMLWGQRHWATRFTKIRSSFAPRFWRQILKDNQIQWKRWAF